jgi:hypothetical protein
MPQKGVRGKTLRVSGNLRKVGPDAAAPATDAWFFVDQVHLTDEGNRTVTEILKAELNLA